MQSRLKWLRFIFLMAFLVVLARLFHWQIIESPRLKSIAVSQSQRYVSQLLPRGVITTDDGYPLVMNIDTFTVFATPKTFREEPSRVGALLLPTLCNPSQFPASVSAQLVGECTSRLYERLSQQDRSWVALQTGLTSDQKAAIEGLKIHGIGFDRVPVRFYPEASMSSHVVGFVGRDEQGQSKGYFGIEGRYDLELKGKAAVERQETDALGQPIAAGEYERIDAFTSRNLTLTIRRDIQYVVEQELIKGVQRYGAKAADAIIMEPSTGKIIAMASVPRYDPSAYASSDPVLFKNPTIADSYEPGSTFKVLTVAAGIDAGLINPLTPCTDCGGPKRIGSYTIKTWNNQYTPNITMTEALVKSDNTAMMFVADKLGKDRFLSYLKKFGIGKETGIDLQEEASPRLRDDDKWVPIDVATLSFGQGVAVTSIQMVNAVNAIANQGVLMRPMVVEKVEADDEVFTMEPKELGKVVSKETASTVATMMIESASHGDAKWTLPAQFSIAGKTGTAQIPVDGHYDENRTIASFVGFAPANNPKFTMLVRVIEPTTSQWGSETAAPLWFTIAKELFVKFDISPKQL